MKRRFKLWTAYMLILCMSLAVMLPNSKSVKADDVGELIISDFQIFKNGVTPLSKDVELMDGDRLSVRFAWKLSDADHSHKIYSTRIEDYDLMKIFDRQVIDLNLSDEVVGKLTVDVDEDSGDILISAEFTDEYRKTYGRKGGASMEAYADVHKGSSSDGNVMNISINFNNFPFTYRTWGGASSLWLWKSALDAAYKDADGNYKQDFYVSLTVNGGDVTDVKLTELPGTELSLPNKIVIDKSNMSGIEEGTQMTLAELNSKLTKLSGDTQIGFTYTADVKGNVFSQSAAKNGDYKNTIKADYKDSEGAPKSAEESAEVKVSRPSVNKSGEIVKDGDGEPVGKIKWTVKIDLNGLAGQGITITEGDIKDDFLANASDVKLEETKKDGKISGYVLTYETDIPDADMGSWSDHTYRNTAVVTIKGEEYTGEAAVTLPAKSWIEKTIPEDGYDAAKKTLSWIITINVPDIDITNVSLDDWADGINGAWHELIKDSVRIQFDEGEPVSVPEIDWENIQPVCLLGDTIMFNDEYIAAAKTHKLTIYADTQIKNDTVDGMTYVNKAYLNYTLDGKPTRLEASDEWRHVSAIIKTGAANSSATAIDYNIDISLSELELKDKTSIIVRDMLPVGLTFDKDSCELIGNQAYEWWNSYDYELSQAVSPVKVDANGRDIRFEIPINPDMIQRIQAEKAEGRDMSLSLKYTAAISDVRTYISDGKELTFINTASAEYDNNKIGDSTNVTKITPKQMISKDKKYNGNTAPYVKYTIKVNPDRLDLSDGNKITVTDSMGEALTYCLDTIQVQKNENGNQVPLENGKDYSYVYSQKDNTLIFTLPASESWVITYDAYVDAYIDDKLVNNGTLTEQDTYNNICIEGYTNDQSQSGVYLSGQAITPNGWAQNVQNTKNEAKLLKIYESENGTVLLAGCKFRLAEFEYVGGRLVEGKTLKTVVTDENGSAKLSDMSKGQLYGLVETEVPEGGFTVKKQPLYFIFGNSELYPFPSEFGVEYLNNGGTVIFENDAPGRQEESVKPSEPTKPTESTKPSDTQETSKSDGENPTKKGDVEGEGNTPTESPSKAPEKEPEGATDPDNDRNGDLEGEGNLVNTFDHPYIKVILVLLILGVIAAVVTEVTMLWNYNED